MNLDLTRVAFSAPLTYLAVSDVRASIWNDPTPCDGLHLRITRGGCSTPESHLAQLVTLKNGTAVPFTYEATPWELILRADGGEVRMAYDRSGQLRCVGTDLQLQLRFFPGILDEFLVYGKDCWFSTMSHCDGKLLLSVLTGTAEACDPGLEAVDQPKTLTMTSPQWELLIEEFEVAYVQAPRHADLDQCVRCSRDAFEAYAAEATEGCPEEWVEAMRQAAYVNYTAQVENQGLIQGRVMLMSKNWMKNIWTWDCAFNAVALASYDPKGAWDNFASPFRRQHATGMLLDSVCERNYVDRYTKPPIHGWALSHLHAAGILDEEKKQWIYERLLKLVNAWYTYQDWDGDGICQYNHGNDSGWDNSTCFACGNPIEGPDLSAYLVLCWDELAVLAEELGLPQAAAEHRARADRQLEDLIRHSWNGERFYAYQSGTHRHTEDGDSLLPFLPIILGNRLPKAIFDKLADGLQQPDRFLTPYGLATESTSSPYYNPDGYWRGPIWAPPMMFIIEGLYKGGRREFARELARRFCSNCARNGFAENFNAVSGDALRDRAYTWTASVFAILVKEILK